MRRLIVAVALALATLSFVSVPSADAAPYGGRPYVSYGGGLPNGYYGWRYYPAYGGYSWGYNALQPNYGYVYYPSAYYGYFPAPTYYGYYASPGYYGAYYYSPGFGW